MLNFPECSHYNSDYNMLVRKWILYLKGHQVFFKDSLFVCVLPWYYPSKLEAHYKIRIMLFSCQCFNVINLVWQTTCPPDLPRWSILIWKAKPFPQESALVHLCQCFFQRFWISHSLSMDLFILENVCPWNSPKLKLI